MFRSQARDRGRPLVRVRYADEWVGLLVILSVVIFAAAVIEVGILRNWLTPSAKIRILLPEAGVAGLAVGNDVEILGIHAGTIRSVRLNPDGAMSALAELDPQVEPFIRRDSQAVIRRRFVVAGATYIEITRGHGDPLDWHYAVIQATTEPNPADMITKTLSDIRAQTLPVLKNAADMTNQLDAMVTDMHNGKGTVGQLLVDDRLIRQAEASLVALNGVIDRLTPIEAQVQATLGNVRAVSSDLKGASPQIPGITRDLAQSAAQLPVLLTQAQAMSESMRQLLDQLRGLWILGGSKQETPSVRLKPGMIQP